MAVATHFETAADVSAVAGVGCRERDYSFLTKYKSLCGFEGRAGRVGCHDGAVEERFGGVVHQFAICFAAFATDKHFRVVGRARHEGKDFACCRFDGDDSAGFALHEFFAICLEVDVDAESEVFSGYRSNVASAVFESTFDASVSVANENLLSFESSEVRFVAFLYTEVAGVVAGTVVVVLFDVVVVHFADVTEQVCGIFVCVLAEDAFLDEKPGEAI